MGCTIEKWCDGYLDLVGNNTQYMKGLVLKNYVNFKTGKIHTKPGYNTKAGPNAKWFILNHCPACGADMVDLLVKQGHLEYERDGATGETKEGVECGATETGAVEKGRNRKA